ncbi:hypothetical protein PFISCL1PPCAC_2673, partial [Pristionchus fissidentatus]
DARFPATARVTMLMADDTIRYMRYKRTLELKKKADEEREKDIQASMENTSLQFVADDEAVDGEVQGNSSQNSHVDEKCEQSEQADAADEQLSAAVADFQLQPIPVDGEQKEPVTGLAEDADWDFDLSDYDENYKTEKSATSPPVLVPVSQAADHHEVQSMPLCVTPEIGAPIEARKVS